jgi:hypothetical protein
MVFQIPQTLCFRFVFICIAVLTLLASCSKDRAVRGYFQDHGMSYPADVSGIGMMAVKYVGIEDDEMLVPGARIFVQDGIIFIKGYFKHGDALSYIPGTSAVAVSKPVFYRDESGEVGIMVKVTGYGEGDPGDKTPLDFEWLSQDEKLWRVENYAYFDRNALYKWQYGGMVF